jgi:hypothetical protein
LFVGLAVPLAAHYKVEPAGEAPSELEPAIKASLAKEGFKILSSDGKVISEIWLRSTVPSGPKANEDSVTMPTIPHGTVLGALRFPSTGSDRRGQTIKPGVYTLRFSYYPQNGDHQGVAPQRDFLIMTPAGEDKDLNAAPNFDALMVMSRKASGTPHPAVLSFWKQDTDFKPGFHKEGDQDWILQTKIGDTQVAIILIGKAEG